MKSEVLEALRRQFRPEFLNRIDETVVFHSLSRDHLKQIVDIQLRQLQIRLAERHINLELTERAREYLATTGYDPSYGARPLKRLLQREIETSLGRKLLAGEIGEHTRVVVNYNGRELTFAASPVAEAA
jgi:ATP-dependent Clp protease ATP-binding subunit ClpA